jgi:hypothetical protein
MAGRDTPNVARYAKPMSNAQATKSLTTGTRVRLIGSPGFVGTFNRYYKPLTSGTRNVDVTWDRGHVSTVHESQIEAV